MMRSPGWSQTLPFPVRNVVHRWRSLAGVMVGVGIALGISMTLLGVSDATIELLSADFQRSGVELYVTTRGGKIIAYLPSDTPGTIKNAHSTLSRIRTLPEVRSALGVATGSLPRTREGPRPKNQPKELIVVMGIDGNPADFPGALGLTEGRWLQRTNEIVIGSRLAKEKELKLGDALRVGERDLTVVGIGKLRGMGASFGSDTLAYVDYRTLQERAGLGDLINLIAVDTNQPESVARQIQEMGRLSVATPDDLVRQANEAAAADRVSNIIMIVLTLAIAGLFVHNVLGRSVSERRLTFATLRASGMSTRMILLSVVAEATAIVVAGALVGVLVAQALGSALNVWYSAQFSIDYVYAPDIRLFLTVFGLSLGLGIVSGLFPARGATRVDPILVLREA